MLKKLCERLCLFNLKTCHVTLGAFHTASLSHQVIFPHGVVGSERCESASGTCFFFGNHFIPLSNKKQSLPRFVSAKTEVSTGAFP